MIKQLIIKIQELSLRQTNNKDLYFMLALSLIYHCAGIFREDTITPDSPLVPKFFEEAKKEEKILKKDSTGTSFVSKSLGISLRK